MIVQCPNCQAKFRLPDGKVSSGGTKLRCGKCRHVFSVPAPEPAEADGLTDFDFPDDMTETPETPQAAAASPSAGGGMDDAGPAETFHAAADAAPQTDAAPDDDTPIRPGFSLDDVADIPLPGSRPSKERRRRRLILAVAVAFVLVVGVVAAAMLGLLPGGSKSTAPGEPPAATAPAKPEAAAPEKTAGTEHPASSASEPAAPKPEETAKVKDIMLQNVRQYYVSNEKAGQLFVIEGKAVNNFKTPKEMITLQATLFDDKGAVLASQNVLAGNTVSLFQLQVMTRDELKNALSSQVGVLTNNTNIQTGGETPFMVVFFDPPETVKEFGVKVVDAKDPPKQ